VLGQGAEVFAPVAAAADPDARAGGFYEFLDHGGRYRLLAHAFGHRLGAADVGLGLVADGFQAGSSRLRGGVVKVGNADFDGVVEAPEPQIGLGSALVRFGDMVTAALRPRLAAVEHQGQYVFQSFRL
jgi:hypothetical protein